MPKFDAKLYAIERDGQPTAIMMCRSDLDPHAEALRNGAVREVRPITQAEADAIRAARPKPSPAPAGDSPRAAADMHAALGVLVDAVERQDAHIKALEARLEAVIDASVVTDVVGD